MDANKNQKNGGGSVREPPTSLRCPRLAGLRQLDVLIFIGVHRRLSAADISFFADLKLAADERR